MSLVGMNVLNLNHETVISIMERHLSKMLSPEVSGVTIKRLAYDDHGTGVSIEFVPEEPVFKDDFMDRLRERCLAVYCTPCDSQAGDSCTGTTSSLVMPGVHPERMQAAFTQDVPF